MSGDPQKDPGALDELEASVLIGEVDLDDPRVADLPDEDLRELEMLMGVCAALNEAARTPIGVADEEVARRFLESQPRAVASSARVVRPDPSRSPRWSAGRVGGLLALAAGLAIMTGSFLGDEELPAGGGEGRLGPGSVNVTPLEPVGTVDELEVFRWKGVAPTSSHWQVRIEFKAEGGERREIVSRPLGVNSWEPTQDLPDRIRWRVDILLDDNQEPTTGSWVEAKVRPE